ncbi:MAG TPA: RNA pyrophosphohydrolase [Reyranellaceae bacterium]|nr:RNA pyrophosphohydrolase [Reyranellaceae bacterium]
MTDKPPKGYRPNVGLMLIAPDRRVFVGKRFDSDEAWQMPQGGVDRGETPIEAACRELKEEVGTSNALLLRETAGWIAYDVPVEIAQRLWGGRWRGQAQKWFALAFTGTDREIDIAAHHAEFAEWKWVRASELTELIIPFKRAVYEAVVKEFADLVS